MANTPIEKIMKIYRVYRISTVEDEIDYEDIDGFVCMARNSDEACNLSPNHPNYGPQFYDWDQAATDKYTSWAHARANVHAEYLGVATIRFTNPAIILISRK